MESGRLRLGMLGGGAFGLFAVREFTRLPGVELVAMAVTRRDAAKAFAEERGIPILADARELVRRHDVDMVYVATPPFLHYEQVMLALGAGKHVLCEKPLALALEQADEMVRVARRAGLVLATSLVQRYLAFFEPVRVIVERGLLGEFLHGSLENHASDEGLSEHHWFWNREKSGGIFVEHGVHFFDLFSGWFGPASVVSAQASARPGTGFEDQVNCTLRCADGATVNVYHGFTRPNGLDRLTLHLVFERGEALLEDWIPTSLRIRALLEGRVAREVAALLPGSRLEVVERYSGDARHRSVRNQPFYASRRVEIVSSARAAKLEMYGNALRALLDDQRRRILERAHVPRTTDENGRASLALALEAARLAERRTVAA